MYASTNAKRGLAPRSVYHFRMDEETAPVTDSVNGATVDTLSSDVYTFGLKENAISAEGQSILNAIVNPAGVQIDVKTSGTIIIYSCAKYLDIPDTVDYASSGTWEEDQGQREFHPFHWAIAADFPAYQHEFKYPSNKVIAFGGDGTASPDYAVTEISASGASDNQIQANVDTRKGNLISFCTALKLGVKHTPEVLFHDGGELDWNGNGGIGTDGGGDPIETLIASWDFAQTQFTLAHAHGYVTGCLHVDTHPTKEELTACAKHHYDNAPNGNKDVWPGWNSYR